MFRNIALVFLLAFTVTAWAESLVLDGPMEQGGLVKGQVPPGSKVMFAGKPVRVSGEGEFLIGFHRDEPAKVSLKVTYPDGKVEKKNLQIKKRDYDGQRIDG